MGFAPSDDTQPPYAHELLIKADAALNAAIAHCAKLDLASRESLIPLRLKMIARLELAGEIIREASLTAMALEASNL